MMVHYQIFESECESWQVLFDRAAPFATKVGPDRLIGMSHSEGPTRRGVVTVWSWGKGPDPDPAS